MRNICVYLSVFLLWASATRAEPLMLSGAYWSANGESVLYGEDFIGSIGLDLSYDGEWLVIYTDFQGTPPLGTDLSFFVVDGGDGWYGVVENGVVSMDTNLFTPVGDYVFRRVPTIEATTVHAPEPATWVLLLSGLGALRKVL